MLYVPVLPKRPQHVQFSTRKDGNVLVQWDTKPVLQHDLIVEPVFYIVRWWGAFSHGVNSKVVRSLSLSLTHTHTHTHTYTQTHIHIVGHEASATARPHCGAVLLHRQVVGRVQPWRQQQSGEISLTRAHTHTSHHTHTPHTHTHHTHITHTYTHTWLYLYSDSIF